MAEPGIFAADAAELEARRLLRGYGAVAVAFSGGVDSSVALALAVEELGADHVLALTAAGPAIDPGELESARQVAAALGAAHEVVATHELELPGFITNPPDRCFHCKTALMGELRVRAAAAGIQVLVDGVNADDRFDHRPGIAASDAAGVLHPLGEAGLGKDGVRRLARRLGLANAEKPAAPCLASRIPYGEEITAEKLARVGEAERLLRRLVPGDVRVRDHGQVARLEVPPAVLSVCVGDAVREELTTGLKALGYRYVALDLEGFRSGSLNEVLPPPTQRRGDIADEE